MCSLSVLLPVAATSNPANLTRAYQSVTEQTLSPEEIILVTNQPLTDNIKTAINDLIASDSNSYHEHFPNAHGLGEVLSKGLKRCTEPVVARMDADDISEPDRFAEQLDILSKTEVDIVGSHLAEFRNNPEQPERTRNVPVTHNEISEWMAWRCPMNHPTTMFDREAVLDVGGYRNFPMMEDWDLWARCLAAGLQFQNSDQILVKAQIDDLTDRRGGLNYAQAEFRMAKELQKLEIASRRDTIKHLSLRIPPRLLPPQIRDRIYQLFAR